MLCHPFFNGCAASAYLAIRYLRIYRFRAPLAEGLTIRTMTADNNMSARVSLIHDFFGGGGLEDFHGLSTPFTVMDSPPKKDNTAPVILAYLLQENREFLEECAEHHYH